MYERETSIEVRFGRGGRSDFVLYWSRPEPPNEDQSPSATHQRGEPCRHRLSDFDADQHPVRQPERLTKRRKMRELGSGQLNRTGLMRRNAFRLVLHSDAPTVLLLMAHPRCYWPTGVCPTKSN